MILHTRSGFTLIELLIVVAIIAILAAIAVPNFLEAQVRAKVSRAKADMRSIATALEAYRVDYTEYVLDGNWFNPNFIPGPGSMPPAGPVSAPRPLLSPLTTPISYITSVPKNAFPNIDFFAVFGDKIFEYGYVGIWWRRVQMNLSPLSNIGRFPDHGRQWALVSIGPNRLPNAGAFLMFSEEVVNSRQGNDFTGRPVGGSIYDPSNGTMSNGDVVRVGP